MKTISLHGHTLCVATPSKAAGFAWRYRVASEDPKTLFDAYKNPSHAKRKAWEYCESLQSDLRGVGLTVTGRTMQSFSAAFECADGVVYVTPSRDWLIPWILFWNSRP